MFVRELVESHLTAWLLGYFQSDLSSRGIATLTRSPPVRETRLGIQVLELGEHRSLLGLVWVDMRSATVKRIIGTIGTTGPCRRSLLPDMY